MKNISKILIVGLCMNLFINLDYKFMSVNENKKLEITQNIESRQILSIDPPDERKSYNK